MQPLGTKKSHNLLGKKCPKNSILVTNKIQEIGTGHLGLVWTGTHFLIGMSKHFLSPPTSSGASYLTLGKVLGGAPPIL